MAPLPGGRRGRRRHRWPRRCGNGGAWPAKGPGFSTRPRRSPPVGSVNRSGAVLLRGPAR
jgi:hypothetical protein